MLRIRGADLSFLLQQEGEGQTYRDAGQPRPVEHILADHGASHVRCRLWVNPSPGTGDLASALTLARRVRAAGLRLAVALHYSDTWADPTSQSTPLAWRGQDLSELERTVREYTATVVRAFDAQGTAVNLLQVGNEVRNGMLWPTGRINPYAEGGWEAFLRLLRAGLDGARDAGGVEETSVHVDTGTDNAACRLFFDHLSDARMSFDVLAVSYYPFWNGPLDALSSNLRDLAARYGRDVLVTETAYPWTLGNGDRGTNTVVRAEQLPQAAAYPPTPSGQRAFFDALRGTLARIPDGHGAGFLAWEPAWLPGVELQPGAGNPHDNLGMFTWDGRALPAIDCFREP
jgi:arabinogalactan endo-1,4-beta-galactosidase